MIKKRIIPEHEEEYIVCDECGVEITDYTSHSIKSRDGVKKHFHNMYAGGTKGIVKKTCLDLYEIKIKEKYEKSIDNERNKK